MAEALRGEVPSMRRGKERKAAVAAGAERGGSGEGRERRGAGTESGGSGGRRARRWAAAAVKAESDGGGVWGEGKHLGEHRCWVSGRLKCTSSSCTENCFLEKKMPEPSKIAFTELR